MPNLPPLRFTLFGGYKTRPSYQLTAIGKVKAEELRVSGPKGEVVAALENSGPCTITEITNEAKISSESIKRILNVLIRDGWVRKTVVEE